MLLELLIVFDNGIVLRDTKVLITVRLLKIMSRARHLAQKMPLGMPASQQNAWVQVLTQLAANIHPGRHQETLLVLGLTTRHGDPD